LVGILGPGPTAFDQLGAVPGRQGNRSPNNAPRNAYLTRDDRWVAISASATSVAERVMRLVGRPDIVEQPWFASAGERSRNGDLLDDAVAKWIVARPLTEVTEEFERVGAALAPIYDVAQLMNDPHVKARETITTVDDEDLGPVKMQNLMFRMARTPGCIRFPGRRLGQDNDRFYRESLGLDPEDVAALQEKGVL
jgi:crotonobetainyl-CoA:carnitine CoA-transferase CaiB-like acyl-CoA transferase